MAQADSCLCMTPLGYDECDTETGIAALYYQSPKQISAMTYTADDADCCPEAEVATIVMDTTPTTPLNVELFQPIEFVNQDDNTGAVFTTNTVYDAGNKVRNRTVLFQVNASNIQGECTLDKMVGRELAFIIKFKNGSYKIVNQEGGMKVSAVDTNSNQSYHEVTMTGVPNAIDKYIDTTWAKANIVPTSVDPDGIVADY